MHPLDDTVLHTARFALYPLAASHAGPMYEGLRDPRAYDFIPDLPPASVEALARRYTLLARQASPDGAEIWLNWAIGAAHGAPFAGYVQATVRPAQAAASIAYLVFPDQWRRGVAKEAVGAVVAHLFARHPVERIDAEIDTRNRASVALVEALGFGRTGLTRAADTFKGAVSDEYRYSLIRPAR